MGQTKVKRKKKRRKKHFFLDLLIFILMLVGLVVFMSSSFFDIQKIQVSGNTYYTSEQILDLAKAKTGGNLFWTHMSKWKGRLLEDPYIKSVKISRSLPETVKIKVEERQEYAALSYSGKYIIIDQDALVLRESESLPAVPLLKGFTLANIEPGTALKVEENAMLSSTMQVLKAMVKNELYFKKIDVSTLKIRAYFTDSLACEGTAENLINEMPGLEKIVSDLHQKGIGHGLINVGAEDYFSFNPNLQ